MRVLLLLVTTGCTTVASCPYAPETDCCKKSGECLDYYGADFPYCSEPGQDHGGICSECLYDDDCKPGRRCYEHQDGFRECVNPNACYQHTPFTFTDCR